MILTFDCEQGSPEWFEARRGVPTSSEFQTIMAKGRGGGESVGRLKYLRTLAGEILTGECAESYTNPHMERGKVMEAEARDWYVFQTENVVRRIGFAYSAEHNAGFSSDGLIGLKEGALEIKTKLPHLQLEVLEDGVLPNEHKAQCQGALWLGELEWIDFVSYWPKLPPFKIRVTRDEPYITTLGAEVKRFNGELRAYVERFQLPLKAAA